VKQSACALLIVLAIIAPTAAQDISTPAVPLVVCDPLQRSVDALLEQVGSAIEAGDAQTALDLLSCALQIDPNNPLIYNDRGFIYDRLGSPDAAAQDFARALGLNPYSLLPRLNLAALQFAQQNYEGAYANYLFAIRVDPSRTNGAFFGAGRTLYAMQRYSEAIPYLLRAYHASDDTTTESLDGLGYAGYAFLIEARSAEAWEAFNMLTTAVGGRAVLSETLQSLIAEVESITGRPVPDTRAACGGELVNADPKNAAIAAFVQPGSDLLFADDFAGAIAQYECARALNPFDPIIHSNLGIAYDRNGDAAAAVESFNRAIAIDPYYAGGWVNRGGLRVRQGEYADAITDLNRGLLLDPDDGNGYYWRGRAYAESGRPAAAMVDWRALQVLRQLQFNQPLDAETAALLTAAESAVDLSAHLVSAAPFDGAYSVRVPADWAIQTDDTTPDQVTLTPPDSAYNLTIRLTDSQTLTGRVHSVDLIALTLAGADQGAFYGNFARIYLAGQPGWRVASVDENARPVGTAVFDIAGDLYPVFTVSSVADQAAFDAGIDALYTVMETWTLNR
jgi:tetratricopeptide (TPR) repeat protein